MEIKIPPKSVAMIKTRRLPEVGQLVGYAALIEVLDLTLPLPDLLSALAGTRRQEKDGWRLFPRSYEPDPTLAGHLTFALRYEGVDLHALKLVFEKIGPEPVRTIVEAAPTGAYARRIWFLYEWLTNDRLSLQDAGSINYVNAVDTDIQFGADPEMSRRHRVRNNLPGTTSFCPLVRKTEKIKAFMEMDLANMAKETIGKIHSTILTRAASFLLLKDSKASFEIEGERPPVRKLERWGAAIAEAGRVPLDPSEFLRLQEIVLGKSRFIKLGWRDEGGFVGEHDRDTGHPLPVHISARHEDLERLVRGVLDYLDRSDEVDPVLVAAVISFGFVFIHPFSDGNGRIHRYLIHHVLAEKGFSPEGLTFPVSSNILENIRKYERTLQHYSAPRLPLIEWQKTERNNVEILNETLDLYRYFDATKQVEFLFESVAATIEVDLPQEVEYLKRFDRMKQVVTEMIEMSDRNFDLLVRFLRQNDGHLSKRAREKEFELLEEHEVKFVERAFEEAFGGFTPTV